jgi:exopolysaccharide biosynthesis polyprenyl glycosylphosphotransferase
MRKGHGVDRLDLAVSRHGVQQVLEAGDAEQPALRLVVPSADAHTWRRAGFALVPATLLIDLTAGLTAPWLMSLPARSWVLLTILFLMLNWGCGHYRASIAPSLLDELPGLAGCALVAGAIATSLKVLLRIPVQERLGYAAVLLLAVAVAGRMAAYPLVRIYRRSGGRGDPTIIVGTGRIGSKVANTLLDHPEYGLWPVGYVDDEPRIPTSGHRIPVIGDLDQLADLLRRHRVRNVIVAFPAARESALVEVLRRCDRIACEIFFVPRLYELHGTGPSTEMLWDIPLTRLSRASYRTMMWRWKRVSDVVLASVATVLLSPVMLVCALAVRLEGGPGVIYRQERVGLDGRRFHMLKFRSLKSSDGANDQRWNVRGDSRMGPVGRILRTLSLDELPQLWNVIRGDMSLVGPRPERPLCVEEFASRYPRYVARHRVPAGLTGWAQVHGLRGDTDIGDRVAFDNFYIENWSMWSDIKIMFRTVAQVVGGRGG